MGGRGVGQTGSDRALQLADQLDQLVAGEPERVLPVADQVGERVRLVLVEVGIELGGQYGEHGGKQTAEAGRRSARKCDA